jgi:hypothetical protein
VRDLLVRLGWTHAIWPGCGLRRWPNSSPCSWILDRISSTKRASSIVIVENQQLVTAHYKRFRTVDSPSFCWDNSRTRCAAIRTNWWICPPLRHNFSCCRNSRVRSRFYSRNFPRPLMNFVTVVLCPVKCTSRVRNHNFLNWMQRIPAGTRSAANESGARHSPASRNSVRGRRWTTAALAGQLRKYVYLPAALSR